MIPAVQIDSTIGLRGDGYLVFNTEGWSEIIVSITTEDDNNTILWLGRSDSNDNRLTLTSKSSLKDSNVKKMAKYVVGFF